MRKLMLVRVWLKVKRVCREVGDVEASCISYLRPLVKVSPVTDWRMMGVEFQEE